MFDKYGEFGSAEEINKAAAEKLAKGDTKAVIGIAAENGIDREDAEDFIDGAVGELVTPLMAALGKLKVEEQQLKAEGIIKDWVDCVKQVCTEDREVCTAVRRKDRSLKECMGEVLKYSFQKKKMVHDEIVKAAGLRTPIYLGIPARAELERIVTEYYVKRGAADGNSI